jgi:hypothetical protein
MVVATRSAQVSRFSLSHALCVASKLGQILRFRYYRELDAGARLGSIIQRGGPRTVSWSTVAQALRLASLDGDDSRLYAIA